MPNPWVYVPAAHTYRHLTTGRFIGAAQMLSMRDQFTDAMQESVTRLADRLANGQIDVNTWYQAMRGEIKTAFVDQYVMARGGRKAMTARDWGRLGPMTRQQYGFLGRFGADIVNGRYTDEEGNLRPEAIASRAKMYMNASTAAHERGRVAERGMPDLPAYPGDGTSECVSNCRCHWRIVDLEDGWDCYWMLTPGENCPTCLERSQAWNPLRIRLT